MGLPGTFCVVCGGPFMNAYEDLADDDPDGRAFTGGDLTADEAAARVFLRKHSADEFAWLENIRLFGLKSSLPSLRNGVLGQEHSLPDDTTKEEPEFFDGISWRDGSDFDSSEFGNLATLVPNAKGDMLFAMHAACAKIVRRVIDAKAEGMTSRDALSSLRAYYDALRARCDKWLGEYNVIEWDYYGASQYWGYDRWEYTTGFEPFVTDPMETVDLTTFVVSTLKPATRSQGAPSLSPKNIALSRLEALPAEILQRIALSLPAASLLNLRLSSKSLQEQFPLNQCFFRDTILQNTLLKYVWDLDIEFGRSMQQRVQDDADPDEYWNWRGVARILAGHKTIALSKPNEIGVPYGFWNRCRVWTLLEEVERIVP